jgi:hypothetical protein
MNALIFAIASCVAAGSTNYCHLMGQPFVFSSADQCLQTMSAKLGGGRELLDGRLYTTQPGSSKTWFECEQRPTSEWTPVQSRAPSAAPFERAPYWLMRCVGLTCVRASSVTSVSEKACEISRELAGVSPGIRYTCVKASDDGG